MIIFDTETTGLPLPSSAPLNKQPHITEFAAVKIDADMKVVDQIQFLCKPPVPIPDNLVKKIGITNQMLSDEKPFSGHIKSLQQFFLGCETLIAHNLPFDIAMLDFELRRLNMLHRFPFPPIQLCTMAAARSINGKRQSLSNLFELATLQKHTNAHRAMGDVIALLACYRWLSKKGFV